MDTDRLDGDEADLHLGICIPNFRAGTNPETMLAFLDEGTEP